MNEVKERIWCELAASPKPRWATVGRLKNLKAAVGNFWGMLAQTAVRLGMRI